MRELTKKILETGLVDETVAALLKKWGAITPEEFLLVQHKQVAHETLETFLEKLDELLDTETEADVKETRLEVRITKAPFEVTPLNGSTPFWVAEDEMGRWVTSKNIRVIPGNKFSCDSDVYEVTEIVPIYQNDVVTALQLTVEKEGD